MNKQMKQHLEAVLDAIVENDTDAAKASFHEYLRAKTQTILLGESDDEDDKDDDKKSDDKDDDKKEDKKSDDKKDDKKSDDKKSDKKKKAEEDCEM